MKAQDFIENLIRNDINYSLTNEDQKTIQFEGIEKFIYKKLNSGKFRATKTSDDYDRVVKEKISLCLSKNIPIHLDLSTGATKNPNSVTAPGIDWAEVFNIALLREFLRPISAAYAPGVNLDYFSVAMFEEKVNHISNEDVALYDRQFSELVNYFQNYFPNNFRLQYKRLSDISPKEKVFSAMDRGIEELGKNWDKLPEATRQEKLMRAERNIKFEENVENKEEIILNSALAHDAFCNECWTDEVSPIWYEKDDISLGHRYTTGWAIHVRSAQASTVNFWSGVGVLVEKGKGFITSVLSPKQFEELKPKIRKETVGIFGHNPILAKKLSEVFVCSA